MLSLIHPLWQRLEFLAVPCIAGSFWALAALVQVKLQGGVVEPLVLGAMLVGCLLLLGFVSLRRWRWQSLGTPGLLLLAAIASYLGIATVVSLATDAELLTRDLARQGFFLLVTVAALLGGRWMLERIGAEALLKGLLAILAAGCVVILASPFLREIGVLPEYRLPYRLTGAFTDPNDAGFIACMTVALALAFQANGRQRSLGCLALFLGCAAGIASFSNTASIVLSAILTLFLLGNVRRLRQDLWHTGLTALLLAAVLVWLAVSFRGIVFFGQPESLTAFASNATLPERLPAPIPETLPAPLPGQPALNPGLTAIQGWDANGRVGSPMIAYLVDDWEYWNDDAPARRWRWQRADAVASAGDGAANVPDAGAWADVGNTQSCYYNPADADRGKFLRGYLYYEKEGAPYLAMTGDVGPIRAATAGGATTASRWERARGTMASSRGETCDFGVGGLARRMILWELGAEKALASPLVGNGLYQLHFMEGAPIGHHGNPTGVHNVYLMLVGEAGIIPLVLYLLALFFLARLLWAAPKSLGRDLVVGWVVVLAMFGLTFHHLLTMGAYNFVIGLACATAAFLVQGQRQGQSDPDGGAAAGGDRDGDRDAVVDGSLETG